MKPRCQREGCDKLLSVYNNDVFCEPCGELEAHEAEAADHRRRIRTQLAQGKPRIVIPIGHKVRLRGPQTSLSRDGGSGVAAAGGRDQRLTSPSRDGGPSPRPPAAKTSSVGAV